MLLLLFFGLLALLTSLIITPKRFFVLLNLNGNRS